MDDSVLRAMARWPDVPAVYGCLSLDRRGRWRLRGEILGHPAAKAFIDRNYARDDRGCWYFQNGPQRVFVRLDYTPWVYRLRPAGSLYSHTGKAAGAPLRVYMDEDGAVLIETALGIGLLDDRDLGAFSEALGSAGDAAPGDEWVAERLLALTDGTLTGLCVHFGQEILPLQPIRRCLAAAQFEFVPDPRMHVKAR